LEFAALAFIVARHLAVVWARNLEVGKLGDVRKG